MTVRDFTAAASSLRRQVQGQISRLRRPLDVDAPRGQRYVEATVTGDADEALQRVFRGGESFPYAHVYVHGSWADDTRTAFSDLDDLVIVDHQELVRRDDLRRFESWLNEVDLRFARMDPLQHHGHWILRSQDLRSLDESYMPLHVLEGAVRVQGPARIEAHVDLEATQDGLRRNVAQTAITIGTNHQRYRRSALNLYNAKEFVGSILIMPAYALQSTGERVTKPQAIANMEDRLSATALEPVHWATQVRADWGRALDTTRYRMFSRLPPLFPNAQLYRRAARRIAPAIDMDLFPPLRAAGVASFLDETAAIASGSARGGARR